MAQYNNCPVRDSVHLKWLSCDRQRSTSAMGNALGSISHQGVVTSGYNTILYTCKCNSNGITIECAFKIMGHYAKVTWEPSEVDMAHRGISRSNAAKCYTFHSSFNVISQKNWDTKLFRLYCECSIVACTLFRRTKPPRPCVPQVTNLFLLFHLVIMPSWRSWWEYNYHSASHRYAIFIVMSSPPHDHSTTLFVGFWNYFVDEMYLCNI